VPNGPTMRASQGTRTTKPKSSKVEAVIKSLATNIEHLVTKTPTPHNPAMSKDNEKGQDCQEDKVATLMGYCCIDKDRGVPAMWYEGFSKTNHPNILQHLLKGCMKKWSRAHDGVRINGAVNFSKQFFMNIATLKFNHGASSRDIKWIGWGLTIMTCIPYSRAVWEDLLAEEEAARTTHTTCIMDKELKRSKGT
jgi:hypothetical protein